MTTIEGKVWRFGDNIDTDVIVAGKYLVHDLPEIAKHVMEGIRPEFAAQCGPGDIIVAGTNFGTGSSREMAPRGIQAAGISAVVASRSLASSSATASTWAWRQSNLRRPT